MAEESKKSNINIQYNAAKIGLDLDNSQNNIKKGALSYALNATMENYDANSFQYQNEPGNQICFDFPEGYKLVGKHFIPEKSKIIFFLANPENGGSEIGYMENNDCVYHTLVNAACLNFDINFPIHSVVHKVTNFGTEIYWPDNNGRRFLNIDNIPWIPLETSEACDLRDSTNLDCNKLSLQPDINYPLVSVEETVSGGEITSGTVQFTVQYSDAVGNPYTSFYGVTNPTPIADVDTATVNFNLPVGKSVVVKVDNLNPVGQYQYFNLVVITTVNNISTPYLVGTYFIDDTFKKITYTGQIKTNIQLSMNDVFEKFAFYDKADHVTAVQDILVWKGVTAVERLNYQLIANQIELKWQSYRIPASEKYDETNATHFRGYLRDEVYAFEIIFLLANGKETDGFHIPGREKGVREITATNIQETDSDFIGNPETGETYAPYWKIYNTASVEGTSAQYDPTNDDYKGPYQYGEFAYWESTEEYPCDENIWGSLAGQKIRHHKFPDVSVSPIIESTVFDNPTTMVMEDVAIYAMGLRIDSEVVKDLIAKSELTDAQKADIIGYKIARADRGVNKSIIAKGMLRNVQQYVREEQTYYYPNYPYNDVSEDPFLNAVNNAWTQLSTEYQVHVYNLPLQADGENYVRLEYTNPNTNKISYENYRTVGDRTICSVTRPRWVSIGEYDKATDPVTFSHDFADVAMGNWEAYVPKPDTSSDAVVYPLSYDVYRVEWNNFDFGAAGMRPGWFDIIENDDKTKWLTYRNEIIVRVPIGYQPYCNDSSCQKSGGTDKMRTPTLVEEVRSPNCKDEQPIPTLADDDPLLSRQIFNSPETSFGQPFLGNILKLESVIYGAGKGHHVEVKDNARYRLITEEAQRDALSTAERVADLTQTFALDAMFAVYNSQMTIFRNEVTRRNFARSFNSIASYNYSEPVPNDLGIKQRELDIKQYLIPEVMNVGEDNININNWNRETSVYLRTTETIPLPHNSTNMINKLVYDRSRFTISDKDNCDKPEREEDISVVSYYASIKNQFLNQYGQIYSYDTIDTGFTKLFDDVTNSTEDFIFGGDTFIGRFAYKTKVPFFIDNRVKFPDDSDIFYDEIGNIAYPKYWHSARSILKTYVGDKSNLTLYNFISYKAHNFDCPNSQELIPADADPETNPNRTFYDGYFYMFAYGIPSFYCESSYNLDLRTATNNKEGDFWPHVSTGIPDNWVQESNVTIAWDNVYNYNVTYSKQNKETLFTNLPADWGDEENRENYPFRAIWSDKQNTDADNRVNNWLTYRPLSYHDFPQNYGNLTALDGLKNSAILARFENKSLLYNNLLTMDTSNPQAVYVGNANFFANPPIDFAETDQGYAGSQHKMLLKTPYGALSIDAKRGQVFLINGAQLEDLSQFGSGMHRWFTAHLPFEILKHFPPNQENELLNINIDNNFNGIGLHGVFDSNYERAIITKLDYVPLYKATTFRDGKFYLVEDDIENEIYLYDTDYFCNVSWTISYNFNSKTWISFHSYIPNWYVGENNFYYSGLNYCPNDFDMLVGELDLSVLTTTTTTTIATITTTTTSTTEVPVDCTFDVSIVVSDCDLEGEAAYVDPRPSECDKPDDLITETLYIGYTLSTVDYDTTVSLEAACTGMSYYLIRNSITDFSMLEIQAQYVSITVNNYVFANSVGGSCNYVPDGWYYTGELAETTVEAFRVEDGVIMEIVSCNPDVTTTTTTTTVLPTTTYCYTGVYTNPDPLHPLGGLVQYEDEFGNTQTITGIWDTDYISIEASSPIIYTVGVTSITCTTTTTTTV